MILPIVRSARHCGIAALRDRVVRFWEPELQLTRYQETPRMRRKKHFYWWSNQFVGAGGAIYNGRP